MPLKSGSKLGPYEIVAPLGAGGMGEVYRARDPRLGREVALKILPPAFANDPSRQARFEQEARAAAALNHPNIVGVFDIGAAEGSFYIVSELVSGETLAALIEQGPVPTKRLLDIASQIADGISAAHAARITHRDLKPANIMIASDGRAKILDFGLARQSSAPAASPDATATIHQTSVGMIVGTVNYMSPEQARGREVDYRSDQFSFGLILYEMASGKRAFERPESVQVMSAILTEEPPPLDSKIPAPLRWTIERCLAKEPRDRYESTRDLFQDLRYQRDHLAESTHASSSAIAPITVLSPAPVPAAPKRSAAWTFAACFILGVICAAGILLWRGGSSQPNQSSYRYTPFSFESGGQCCAFWSPDGKAVAYSANASGEPRQIFLRQLDSPTPLKLTHDAGGGAPLGWAPDGRHILFTRASGKREEIWSIASVGGEPELAYTLPAESGHASAISPDARAYASLHEGPDGKMSVWISSPIGSPFRKYEPAPFISNAVYNTPQLRFSPDGKQLLLFRNGDSRREEAWLLPYPPDSSHAPHRILAMLPTSGTPQFDWMPDNRRIILSMSPGDTPSQLWMADTRSDKNYALTSGTLGRFAPSISPDGAHLIFGEVLASQAIVSIDLATAAVHATVNTGRSLQMPSWARTKPVFAYVSNRNGPTEIWLHGPGDVDAPVVSASGPAKWLMGPSLSAHAERIVYSVVDPEAGATHLWMSAAAGGAPVRLTNDDHGSEFPGSWSPDGAWFVYQAIHKNRLDLMKVRASGGASPVVLKSDLSPEREGVPVWSPAGDWIAFDDGGEKLISPNGAPVRDLGKHGSVAMGFDAAGKRLYGMRAESGKNLLFWIDTTSGSETVVGGAGPGNLPGSELNPALLLSLAPDGKSFLYGTSTGKENLWMLSGFSK